MAKELRPLDHLYAALDGLALLRGPQYPAYKPEMGDTILRLEAVKGQVRVPDPPPMVLCAKHFDVTLSRFDPSSVVTHHEYKWSPEMLELTMYVVSIPEGYHTDPRLTHESLSGKDFLTVVNEGWKPSYG